MYSVNKPELFSVNLINYALLITLISLISVKDV